MIRDKMSWMALLAAAGIVLAFFAPWVIVDAELSAPVGIVGMKVDRVTGTRLGSSVTNLFRKGVTAIAGKARVARMSGWQIARSDRNEFMKFVGELTVVVGEKSKDPRQVRFLFLLPIVGFFLGLGVFGAKGAAPRALGVISILIGGFMGYKLLTSPLGNEVAQAHLQWGIWLTVSLFILQGAAGLVKKSG